MDEQFTESDGVVLKVNGSIHTSEARRGRHIQTGQLFARLASGARCLLVFDASRLRELERDKVTVFELSSEYRKHYIIQRLAPELLAAVGDLKLLRCRPLKL